MSSGVITDQVGQIEMRKHSHRYMVKVEGFPPWIVSSLIPSKLRIYRILDVFGELGSTYHGLVG